MNSVAPVDSLSLDALRLELEDLRDLFENAPIGYHELDSEGRFARVNRTLLSMLGYGADEMLGHYPWEFIVEEVSRSATKAKLAGTLALKAFERTFRRKDGTLMPALIEDRWLRDSEGKVQGIRSTIQDITERKRAEDEAKRAVKAFQDLNEDLERRVQQRTSELEAANNELASFSYSVSHDLRTPLHTIGGYSQVLLEDHADQLNEEGRHYLERLRAATQHMGHLIEDMLQLARVTRTDLRREPMDLSRLATAVSEELREAHPHRSVNLRIKPELMADADPRLMAIVFENLLGNAWKFTSKHPDANVEVDCMEVDGQKAFFVRDDGAGFNSAYAQRLFGAFQRLHPMSEFEGTGIGLATVQRVIHRHGGRVWAEGEVNRGATFYFTLG